VHASVSLLLVSHDGASWLPTVIDGVRAQRAPVARVVAVDTGSKDESADLLEQAFGDVVRARSGTAFPEAVEQGLQRLAEAGGGTGPDEWVWILHDDSTPDPGALEALLAAAAAEPDAEILGPKLREWPSLRRLLELGVTISGTGRRETGLERGEYDQGQHDTVRDVLAVNTAGMLVRRRVLEELGGFDEHLPMFGNDIDFGWRAAAAGHRAIVVPDAIVFHAEAAHRGVRRTPLTGRHTHYQERRAALFTLLANRRAAMLPWTVVRLVFGTLLRMIGFLGVRDVGAALDDLAALLNVYARPGSVIAARRARKAQRSSDPAVQARVTSLLPAWWLPYRHGLDFAGDVVGAVTTQAADVAERRRAAKAEADPASFAARRQEIQAQQDEDELPVENGWLVRFLTNPVAVLCTLVAVLGVIGARTAFGEVSGGALSPVPEGATDWWALHLESWHALGQGSGVPAPAYVLPLALLATLLGGHAGLAITLVLVLSFPIALWGAWRLLRVVGRLVNHRGAPRGLVLWGAAAYALVPAVSGAWGDGRLGPVVTGAVLPWLVHAALGFADPEADRRWRAAWRAGLLLALVTAFAPSAWFFGLVLAALVVGASTLVVRGAVRERSVWGPPATALAVPVGLLLPWWLPALVHGGGAALLLEPGRLPAATPTGLDLLLGRLPELGAPWWLGLVLPVLAVVALVPVRTRIPVLVCWIAGVALGLVALLLSVLPLGLAAGTTAPGYGFALVALQGAAVVAVVLGAQGALSAGLTSWQKPVGVVLGVLAVVPILGGLGWYVVSGTGALDDGIDDDVPAYMLDATTNEPTEGVLVLRGTVDEGLRYSVLREDGHTLGEDEVDATTPEDTDFSAAVRTLASAPDPAAVEKVAAGGVTYVVMPEPADPSVAEGIDASGGVTQASTADRQTRAWQLDAPATQNDLDGHTSWLRILLFVVQLGGLVVVAVLCLPTLERGRRR